VGYRQRPIPHDGAGLDGTDSEDRRLRGVDHRRERLDVEHPHVADGERAAREVLAREASLLGQSDQTTGFACEVGERTLVGMAEHRDDQSILDRDRHAEIHLGVHLERPIAIRGVQPRMAYESARRRFPAPGGCT